MNLNLLNPNDEYVDNRDDNRSTSLVAWSDDDDDPELDWTWFKRLLLGPEKNLNTGFDDDYADVLALNVYGLSFLNPDDDD